MTKHHYKHYQLFIAGVGGQDRRQQAGKDGAVAWMDSTQFKIIYLVSLSAFYLDLRRNLPATILMQQKYTAGIIVFQNGSLFINTHHLLLLHLLLMVP